jgi:hypothetical protein
MARSLPEEMVGWVRRWQISDQSWLRAGERGPKEELYVHGRGKIWGKKKKGKEERGEGEKLAGGHGGWVCRRERSDRKWGRGEELAARVREKVGGRKWGKKEEGKKKGGRLGCVRAS